MNTSEIYFKQELCWLFFQLSRKSTDESIKTIHSRLDICLKSLKKNIQIDESKIYIKYLKYFYSLICYTRDSYKGLGEQKLSYMLIVCFYNHFPNLSIYAIQRFVKPSSSVGSKYTYGCWRDLKYICQYAYNYTNENHEIINHCIEIMNKQLHTDYETWKYSSNCFSLTYISNVAKHIPREKSKFSWLYDKLCVHWIQTHKPFILQTANNVISYKKALNKSKKIYRKIISYLNKALNTSEINICNLSRKNEDEFVHVVKPSLSTALHNSYLFLNSHNNSQNSQISSIFKNNLINSFDSNNDNTFFNGLSYSKISIYQIVKYAFDICDNTTVSDDVILINKIWTKCYMQNISNCNETCIVPIIDVSSNANEEMLYTSIGIAILLSHISTIKYRILAVDRRPTWIVLNPHHSFVEQIIYIRDTIYNMHNTNPNFISTFNLIIHTFFQMNANSNFVDNMKLVIFSDQNDNCLNEETITDMFHKNNIQAVPDIIFWNLSHLNCVDLPCDINSQKSMVLSGYSTCHIHNLCYNYQKKYSMFQQIIKIISNKRYECFSNYIDKLDTLQ